VFHLALGFGPDEGAQIQPMVVTATSGDCVMMLTEHSIQMKPYDESVTDETISTQSTWSSPCNSKGCNRPPLLIRTHCEGHAASHCLLTLRLVHSRGGLLCRRHLKLQSHFVEIVNVQSIEDNSSSLQ